MDRGMEEILCGSCSHKDVCAYKDDYLNTVKSLQEMFSKNERYFMYLRDPDCKFYSKESSTPKALTQMASIPEDELLKIKTTMEKHTCNLC